MMVHHGDASTAEVQNAAATKKEVHNQLTVLFHCPFQTKRSFSKEPHLYKETADSIRGQKLLLASLAEKIERAMVNQGLYDVKKQF